MSLSVSQYLTTKALMGLEKVGDVMLPGDEDFPRFSEVGCIHHVDDVMGNTHPDDVKLLQYFFTGMYYLPSVLIDLLMRVSLLDQRLPDTLGTPLRLISFALRGVPMTLYYSNLHSPYYTGNTVHEVMGYAVNVEGLDEGNAGEQAVIHTARSVSEPSTNTRSVNT